MAMKLIGICLILLGLAAVPVASAQEACKTSFTLVGKEDSKWYLDGAGAANPTLTACPSSAITFTVRTEGSLPHNFQVQNGPEATATLGDGEEATYTWNSGAAGSSATYVCLLHGTGMSGRINVAQTAGAATGGDEKKSPGLELAGLAIALAGAALVLRRK
ncbi:MAG TPA: hypothetical protein VHH36_08460 [Candidatus Thermoplasmatota archaeon]|nr:hypothetical protein [Candidatus Thermoplasmatota archaeon]